MFVFNYLCRLTILTTIVAGSLSCLESSLIDVIVVPSFGQHRIVNGLNTTQGRPAPKKDSYYYVREWTVNRNDYGCRTMARIIAI